MAYRPDFVPNLINNEPTAFMGLTLNELVHVTIRSFLTAMGGIAALVTLVFPHPMMYVAGFMIAMFVTVAWIRRTAKKRLDENRGRDFYYSRHKAEIAREKLITRINTLRGKKDSGQFRYVIEDGYYSQR